MPFHSFVPNEVLTALNLNTLQQQCVITCTSATRPTPVTGMMIAETDTTRIQQWNGSAWIIVGHWAAGGRVNCIVSRSTPVAVGGINTPIVLLWQTTVDDGDSFISTPSGTFVVPAGLGGIYSVEAQMQFSAAAMSPRCWIDITVTGRSPYRTYWDGDVTQFVTANVVTQLNAGDNIQIAVRQENALIAFESGRCEIQRLAA